MGIDQDSVGHNIYYQLTNGIIEYKIDELGSCQSLREMNLILLDLKTYEVGIYQDSIRHWHYSQLTRGILNSETGEFSLPY